jgi:hypothetical protein
LLALSHVNLHTVPDDTAICQPALAASSRRSLPFRPST